MKERITKCSNPGWWYANKIDMEIKVEKRYYLIPEDEEKKQLYRK